MGGRRTLTGIPENWRGFPAQDLGTLLTGSAAQAKAERRDLYEFATPLRPQLES